jgi:hypothetical protein
MTSSVRLKDSATASADSTVRAREWLSYGSDGAQVQSSA